MGCFWEFSEFVPIGLNGQNDVLFAEKCIQLVCEKLTIFPYGQDIVGNDNDHFIKNATNVRK